MLASSARSAVDGREFELTDRAFNRIRELVREHTGIVLSDAKRHLVYGRLARRLRALELSGFEAYVELLERAESEEISEFTNCITTNLTSFFREPHHFDYLANQVVAALARHKRGAGRVRIWSCACSTGEEPYSIAMVLREQMKPLTGMDIRILASDIDSDVLATAEAGIYTAERLRGVSQARMSSFFRRGVGSPNGGAEVAQTLRVLITFRQLNLMREWPMRGPFDVIFCRNAIIYFDKETQRSLFERMAALQRPGDLLFLGHSESLFKVSDKYELIGRTIYRRVGV
jgi:chemotaxis protein methyltransferase CheR